MNRQERRRKKREGKKMQGRSNKRINSVEYEHLITAFNVSKLVSMLVLRDKGWGNKRLMEYSADFDELLKLTSDGYLTALDISETLEKETGVLLDDIRVKG